jgi:putative holliday junction resolvase
MDERIYLGVDWGEKRIGLALADGEIRVATPFKTVGSFSDLVDVIKEEMVDVLVLGKPIKMRGEQDGLNPDFTSFLDRLRLALPEITIELVDERLSSQQADKLPGDKKTKAGRDEMAAMIILQNYFDRLVK